MICAKKRVVMIVEQEVDGRLQSDKARQEEEEQSRAAVRIDHFTARHVPASRVPARLRSFAVAALHACILFTRRSIYSLLLQMVVDNTLV